MDTVLRGATVVDGSGEPRRRADVRISGPRIAEMGEPGSVDATGARIIDLSGLVLSPGFIDIHTHYDAQVTWDPDLTPSCWHGVTSVVLGNCGFGIAPLGPEQRETIARTLENVEGMSYEALVAGLKWGFETFPEYLDFLDQTPKRLNVSAFIGHTPLRLYVMGEAASERAATGAEVARMRELVAEGLAAGAVGFSTSRSPGHVGEFGKPVPSRFAEVDEVRALAGALTDAGTGIFEIVCGPDLTEDALPALAADLGRRITYTALVTGRGSIANLVEENRAGAALEFLNRVIKPAKGVFPQIACRPIVVQLTLEDPLLFFNKTSFRRILEAPRPDRAAIYADPAWRAIARPEVESEWGQRWHRVSIAETTRRPDLVGIPFDELAKRSGKDPFDLLVDLSLEENLTTRFLMEVSNADEEELGKLLQDPRPILGVSDAGAHASQLCDACYSTYLLEHWVRDLEVLTLEQAVWRLTGHPAEIYNLAGRGLLRPGYAADLVAFDADTVGTTAMKRVWDFPAGADRLIVKSKGIEHIWINGVRTRQDGEDLDLTLNGTTGPGELLRNTAA